MDTILSNINPDKLHKKYWNQGTENDIIRLHLNLNYFQAYYCQSSESNYMKYKRQLRRFLLGGKIEQEVFEIINKL